MLTLCVHRLEWAAQDIIELELRAPDGAALPAYEPGAHIELRLPNGLARSYSLKGASAERDRYVVAVGLDANSRGGSRFIHESLRVGSQLSVRAPANHFPLVEAAHSVLIAGGIGVTPMTCMARALHEKGASFAFHYAVRSQNRAAFADELRDYCPGLHLHCDDEAGGPLDLASLIQGQPEGTHFYCCGPAPMMAAFEGATAQLDDACRHVEYFSAKPVASDGKDAAFTLVLQRSMQTLEVGAEESIIAALERAGVRADTSCEDGICGTCETRILDGNAEHRDSVLTKKEQDAGRTMMICVSRCKGDRLVLDL